MDLVSQGFNQENIIQEVYEGATLLIEIGLSRPEVEAELVAQGLDSESASGVVAHLLRQQSQAQKEAAKDHLLYGALLIAPGILLAALGILELRTTGGMWLTWSATLILAACLGLYAGLVHDSLADTLIFVLMGVVLFGSRDWSGESLPIIASLLWMSTMFCGGIQVIKGLLLYLRDSCSWFVRPDLRVRYLKRAGDTRNSFVGKIYPAAADEH